ncbi:hypothetical protein GCM10028791_08660 [Echinicola sediminis]
MMKKEFPALLMQKLMAGQISREEFDHLVQAIEEGEGDAEVEELMKNHFDRLLEEIHGKDSGEE